MLLGGGFMLYELYMKNIFLLILGKSEMREEEKNRQM